MAFAGLIGGIQLLGWWARPAAAQSPVVQAPPANAHVFNGPAMHWRDLVMHP